MNGTEYDLFAVDFRRSLHTLVTRNLWGKGDTTMLIGMGKTAPDKKEKAASGIIFDATARDFETRVLRASLEKPVIVDFWAPWCGPCKQLGPVLEAAVEAAGGAVLMAKVNIDESPELAQALRIQSVPTVYAFFQGQPVDAFMGARPPAEIKAFIERLMQMAGGGGHHHDHELDIPEALKQAAQALSIGDLASAQGIYGHILQHDERNAEAYAGLLRTFIAAGALDEAQALLDQSAQMPELAKAPALAAVRTALDLARQRPAGSLEALALKVSHNPQDLQARYDLAIAEFAAGRKEAAIDSLLEIVRLNRGWEEEKARQQLLKIFEALGPADPATLQGRRKLSSLLFS